MILAACAPGGAPADPVPAAGSEACLVAADPVAPPLADVRIAVSGPIVSDAAPAVATLGERFTRRQLFTSLVWIDCAGRVIPGLAERWRSDAAGERWTFDLRPKQTFASGGSIDAEAVSAAWTFSTSRNRHWSGLVDAAPNRLVLEVVLREPSARLPPLFADLALAVVGNEGRWGPGGESGGYQVESVITRSGSLSKLVLMPMVARSRPRLSIVASGSDRDLRDLLERPLADTTGADVVFTRDPVALDYARGRAEFMVVPLAWDRTYVAIGRSSPGAAQPSDPARDAVARDAVRSEARGAVPPFWWENPSSCASVPASGSTAPFVGQVVYPVGDPIARDLAERIVALASGPDRPPWIGGLFARSGTASPTFRAVGLAERSLDSVIAAGRVAGAVVPYPRLEPAVCDGLPRAPAGLSAIPLIDSRAHVIARRGVPAFAIDGDGAIRFMPWTSR